VFASRTDRDPAPRSGLWCGTVTAPREDRAASPQLQPMYQAILDAAMDAVVTIDHLGRVMEVSDTPVGG